MGLALSRQSFDAWVVDWPPSMQERLFAAMEESTGIMRSAAHWPTEDQTIWRLGSYTRYGIFTLLLHYLIDGDSENELEDDQDIELAALQSFRSQYAPASKSIEYAAHFTGTGDCDTIFVPAMFDEPVSWEESWVASMPAAIIALESLARLLRFSLTQGGEPEEVDGKWDAVATARNVARDLFMFFRDSKNTCVAYS